ncbi:MAG: hypothetical protein C5B58_00960 [Acidobacteria bacterium]|nr:MAG: hypothetical protein C5B58_00960 [Acidobacteriota bacterium]
MHIEWQIQKKPDEFKNVADKTSMSSTYVLAWLMDAMRQEVSPALQENVFAPADSGNSTTHRTVKNRYMVSSFLV